MRSSVSPGTRGWSHLAWSHRCRRACESCGKTLLLQVALTKDLWMARGRRPWTTGSPCGLSAAVHRAAWVYVGLPPAEGTSYTGCPHHIHSVPGLRKNACPQSYPQVVDNEGGRRAGYSQVTLAPHLWTTPVDEHPSFDVACIRLLVDRRARIVNGTGYGSGWSARSPGCRSADVRT